MLLLASWLGFVTVVVVRDRHRCTVVPAWHAAIPGSIASSDKACY